jgi:hypothetical protein
MVLNKSETIVPEKHDSAIEKSTFQGTALLPEGGNLAS